MGKSTAEAVTKNILFLSVLKLRMTVLQGEHPRDNSACLEKLGKRNSI
jgi:hypothetical protein